MTPWTTACQASLSSTLAQSLLKLMSIELMMSSNHLILCHPPFLLLSIFFNIRVFSKESALGSVTTELMLKHTKGGSLPSQMNAFIKLIHANINGRQRFQIWGQVWQRPDMNNSRWSRIEENARELIVKPEPDGVFTEWPGHTYRSGNNLHPRWPLG